MRSALLVIVLAIILAVSAYAVSVFGLLGGGLMLTVAGPVGVPVLDGGTT